MVRRRYSGLWVLLVVGIAVGLLWYFGQKYGEQPATIPAVIDVAVPEQPVEVPLVVSPYVNYHMAIETLYKNVSGYRIDEEEKKAIRNEGGDPTYGEILYESAEVLLNDLQLTPDDVFYDLGSGAGKFVDQAYVTTPVKKAAGIELSKTRYEMAQARVPQIQALAEISAEFDYVLNQALTGKTAQRTRIVPSKTIEFINENILKADLSDATVIFMCSTCFSDELMQKIVDKLADLREGLRVLTLKDLPPHEHFKLVRQYQLPMSWSKSSPGSPVYLYRLDPSTPLRVSEAGIEVAVDGSQENFEK